MTNTPTTPQAAAFIEATRVFVAHLAAMSAAGIEAYRAGHIDTANSLLSSIEDEMGDAFNRVADGHTMGLMSSVRFHDGISALGELVPTLPALAGLVDEDHDHEVDEFIASMMSRVAS